MPNIVAFRDSAWDIVTYRDAVWHEREATNVKEIIEKMTELKR